MGDYVSEREYLAFLNDFGPAMPWLVFTRDAHNMTLDTIPRFFFSFLLTAPLRRGCFFFVPLSLSLGQSIIKDDVYNAHNADDMRGHMTDGKQSLFDVLQQTRDMLVK